MKRKFLVIIFVCVMFLTITGCGEKKEEISFQSRVIKNNNSYDYNDYYDIASLASSFELALFDQHIDITSISFENSKYNNGTFKVVTFTLADGNSVTLKFNDDQKLILVNTMDFKTVSIRNAILYWSYWGFSGQNVLDAFTYDNLEVGNFIIEGGDYMFTITDSRYK